MAAYSLRYKQSVKKDLRKFDKVHLAAVVRRIELLAIDPRPNGSISLQGDSGLYRVRQGSYRIIYSVDDVAITVLVVKVGHRKDVYDKV